LTARVNAFVNDTITASTRSATVASRGRLILIHFSALYSNNLFSAAQRPLPATPGRSRSSSESPVRYRVMFLHSSYVNYSITASISTIRAKKGHLRGSCWYIAGCTTSANCIYFCVHPQSTCPSRRTTPTTTQHIIPGPQSLCMLWCNSTAQGRVADLECV
jgi:hypothetical protein